MDMLTGLLFALWTAVLPHLLEIVSIATLFVIGRTADKLRVRFGLDIDARHRAALHMALMNGLRTAIQRAVPDPVGIAVGYAMQSTPDAIAALRGKTPVLFDLAESMLPAARAEVLQNSHDRPAPKA